MSSFTEQDLQAVNAAIIDLVTGKARTTVSVAGRSVTYQTTQLSDLRALRTEIKAELASAQGKNRTWLTRQRSKGL